MFAIEFLSLEKRLNEHVKRNLSRFPADFMFRLMEAEKLDVVANCDQQARLNLPAWLWLEFLATCSRFRFEAALH